MEFDTNQITQLASTIWESVLGMPVEPVAEGPASRPARATAACVQITGAWNGAVMLDCPVDVARRAASIMFGIPPADVAVAELQDAVAELVNMVGGNLKALLPEKCFLSLPAVVEGGDLSSRIPGSRLMTSVCFKSEGHTVVITVREKIEPSAVAA